MAEQSKKKNALKVGSGAYTAVHAKSSAASVLSVRGSQMTSRDSLAGQLLRNGKVPKTPSSKIQRILQENADRHRAALIRLADR